MFKYPIEIELTDFCSLSCVNCINPLLKNKGLMSYLDFENILNYLYDNIEYILYINFSWIGDIFLHPDIEKFLLCFIDKFKGTNIKVLIPTKGQSYRCELLPLFIKMRDSNINLNISVWIFSLNALKHNLITKKDSFNQSIYFMKELKKNNIHFSLELISNNIKEIEYLKKLSNIFECWYSIQNYHNFWWILDNIKVPSYYNWSSFWIDEDYTFKWFYCSFIPMIWKDWNIYTCSISGKKEPFLIWNYKDLFLKYRKYEDLVFYIKYYIESKKNCSNCTIFKIYNEKKINN